ncbi:MAG TPA: DJ-1/PfpI family protein [Chryseolinea sp.]|nr:DJ-1/PfpI family protein [Chryseolinea sp.]
MQAETVVCFLLFPRVHLMDLAGPVQVFYEASKLGSAPYKVTFCGVGKHVMSEQGLGLGELKHFEDISLKKGDFIFIPGMDFRSFTEGVFSADIKTITPWLRDNLAIGVQIASVCSGALVLAASGLLDRKKCTSHWKCIDYMTQHFPMANVQTDTLYVQDGNIFSSAGMTSGIDMALSILEAQHGPVLPAKVAREIVVYMRRNNMDHQQTIYLDYRTHFNPSVHKVQDYIISNPAKNPGLEELAAIGNTSVRTLTRSFKSATGHTIIEFKNAVKVELARTLIHNKSYTMEKISSLCGFQSVRHLRRIWGRQVGMSLTAFRRS